MAQAAAARRIAMPSLRLDRSALLALPVGAPLLYLVYRVLAEPPATALLAPAATLRLLAEVGALALAATAIAIGVGLSWAWLVTRTDLPARGPLRVLGALPLAIPPYVMALAYAVLLAPGGELHRALAAAAGTTLSAFPYPSLFYSPLGAAFVLGLATSPYVFLMAQAGLLRTDPQLTDAARTLGLGGRAAFLRVTLPLLAPAIAAGALLVFLYVFVDFGVVSLLRVRTFTTIIYDALLAGFDLSAAMALSLALVAIVWAMLLLQRLALRRRRYVGTAGRMRPAPRASLGAWRPVAVAYALLLVGLTLLLPLGVLVAQLGAFAGAGELVAFLAGQLRYLANSLAVSIAAATLVAAAAIPVAWSRWKGAGGESGSAVLQAGYALPGTVLALGIIGFTLAVLPAAYGTPLVLVFAYFILFGAPAQQAARAALAQVAPVMEEAARVLGRGTVGAFRDAVAPLAWSGLVASWLLVFMLAMRELAATVILRPAGYDTLAVRIWVHTVDVGPDARAAAVALLLTGVIGLAWLLVLTLEAWRADRAAEVVA